MLVAFHATIHRILIACICATALDAQSERQPESFQLGIGMQLRELHQEAAKHLSEFVRDHTDHELLAEGYYRLAHSRTELLQITPAIQDFRAALAHGGAQFLLRAESQYRLAKLLQNNGDPTGALNCINELIKEINQDHYLVVAATYARGELQRDLKNDKAAAESFADAAKLSTGKQSDFLFPSLYQGGFAHLRMRHFDHAAAAFAAAHKAAPSQAAKGECLYLFGDAQLRLGNHKQADQTFRKAIEIPSDHQDDAQFGLGWSAVARDDAPAAIRAFRQLIANHPNSPLVNSARLLISRSLYETKQYEEGLRQLGPLLVEGNELQLEARELEGLCAIASGEGQSAIVTLRRALSQAAKADKPRLQFALGGAYANLNRWQDALSAYQMVPATASSELRGDAMYGACHALHELGKYEPSIGIAKQVIKIEPPHRLRTLAQLALAENRFALRQYDQASKAYLSLQTSGRHKDLANWKLSWCEYLTGQQAAAAKSFKAIAQRADDPNREEALAMQAKAHYESDEHDQALAASDAYLRQYGDGKFLDRTERIASRVLQQRGELSAAQQRLAQAAAIASKRDGARAAVSDVAEQADLAYQRGDYAGADALFEQVISNDSVIGARALAGRTWCAFEIGDDTACIRALAIAKSHPMVAEELAGLLELESALHHRMKSWSKAAKAARQFLKAYPKHEHSPQLQYALGVALARGGEQAAARKVLAQLAQAGSYANPDSVMYELAWAARRDGDEQAALGHFRKVAASSQNIDLADESALLIGTSLLDGKQASLQDASRWLKAVRGNLRGQARYRLGFAQFEAANKANDATTRIQLHSQARENFTIVARIKGDELQGESLYLCAECSRLLRDYPAAVNYGKRLLNEFPEHERIQQTRLSYGEHAVLNGQAGAAIAPLEDFLRNHDASKNNAARSEAAQANLWLGKAHLMQGQPPIAQPCFVKVCELNDGLLAAEAQFQIGVIQKQRKDLQGAVDAFLKLPILYRETRWARSGLLQAGLTYLQLNQPAKAKRLFSELVEKHKGTDEATLAATKLQNR